MKIRLLKLLDASLGMFLCWLGGRILFLFHREMAPVDFRTIDIKRILVIRPGGFGDMILLQPALQELQFQYPRVRIELVCERRNEAIISFSNSPITVISYDAQPFRLLFRLCTGRYDVVLDSEQFHYFSAVMALLSRAPVRIGYKINPGRNSIYTHLINYDLKGYEADEFMKLLRPLGVVAPARIPGCLLPPKVALPEALGALWLKLHEPGVRLVLVHVGASVRHKIWAPENFIGLVRSLCEDTDTVVGLIGGPGDAAMAKQVAEQCEGAPRVLMLAGRLSLPQTAKLITKAVLFVGGDSGLAHLAAAFGVPSVVMFGPSDAQKWARESERIAIVKKDMACSPCFIFGYHKHCRTISCMKQVGVDDVLMACRRMLLR